MLKCLAEDMPYSLINSPTHFAIKLMLKWQKIRANEYNKYKLISLHLQS